ncbi:cullin-binding protein, putative, partial [Bodo saltans]
GGGSRAPPQEAAAVAATITALTSGHGFLVMMWLCTGGQLRHFVQDRSDGDDSISNNGVLLYEEFEANVYVHCPGARSLGEAVDVVMSAVKGSFHLHRQEQRRLQQKQQCVSSSFSSSTAADETTAYPQQQHQEIIRAPSEDAGAPPPPLSLSFHMFAFELLGAVEHQFVARTPMSRRHHHNAAATAAHPPPTSPPHSGGLSSIDEMIARLARECDEKRGGAALHSNTNNNNSHVLNDNSGGRHDNEADHHHSPQSAELHKTTQGSNVGNTTTATTVTTVLCGIFRNAREVGALRVLQLTLGSSSSQIVPHLVSFMQYRSIQLGSNGGAGGALPSSNLLHYRGASSSNGRLTTTTATTTRTISKDFWYMIYLFCASDVQYPLFEGYRDTDSWPSLLDQFVDWSRRSVVVRW